MGNTKTKCPNCGEMMQWEDTLDVEGGLLEGYIIERMLFSCNNCNKDFITDVRVSIEPAHLKFENFTEN